MPRAGQYIRGATIPEADGEDRYVTAGRLPVLSQDFLTPADYFVPGAELPGNYRNARFYVYSDLYEGEHYPVIDSRDYPVHFSYHNWFAYGADLIKDFIMSSPPESSSPQTEELNEILGAAIISYIQNGVAVFAIGEDGMEVVQPQYFYPMDDDTFVTLRPFGPQEVEVRFPAYSVVHNLDHGDTENWYSLYGYLGHEVEDSIEAQPERTFYTVASQPGDGMFGNSTFRRLVPAVADHTAINSHYLSQDKIASMIVVAKRESGQQQRVDLPLEGRDRADKGEDTLKLARLYGTIVEGYESFGFVQGRLDPASYRESRSQAEQRIYDIFGIAPSLAQKLDTPGMAIASGVALERTYVRSAATFNEIIKAFTPVINEMLNTEIEWDNPLAALREEAEVNDPVSTSNPQDNPQESSDE